MSEIVKTEGIILSKLNYGDTSVIVNIFTKDYGKISAMLKGARNQKSNKTGRLVDPLNYLQLVLYNKSSREIQLISEVSVISYYPNIKENLDKLKYSFAVIELLNKLLPEHEVNNVLFKGTVRILDLLNTSNENEKVIFGRYFMFFLKVIGYELQLESCHICGKTNLSGMTLSYNFENGILCQDCHEKMENFQIEAELFKYLICLKNNYKVDNIEETIKDKALFFMEMFLKYHVPSFQRLDSFKLKF